MSKTRLWIAALVFLTATTASEALECEVQGSNGLFVGCLVTIEAGGFQIAGVVPAPTCFDGVCPPVSITEAACEICGAVAESRLMEMFGSPEEEEIDPEECHLTPVEPLGKPGMLDNFLRPWLLDGEVVQASTFVPPVTIDPRAPACSVA